MNLEQKVDELGKKVNEIYDALMGSKFNEKGGYKPRIESLESRVTTIEDLINRWKWILVGALSLGGYGGVTIIQQFGEFLFKNLK